MTSKLTWRRAVLATVALAAVAIVGTRESLAQSGSRDLVDRLRQQDQQREMDRFRSSAAASASGTVTVDSLEFPSDKRLWRNSSPLSLEALEGKGVVFYFFEEECSFCAENWPALNAMAQKHQAQQEPVIFIAVNSGTDPRAMARYIAQYRVQWPVILDVDRSLENALGVPALSADGNVFAVRYRNGKGDYAGAGADFEKTVQAALKGASWRVNPSGMPSSLRGAWQSIEFGDFPAAAKAVNKAVSGKDGPVKSGGEKLLKAVEAEVTDLARTAQDGLKQSNDWVAYKALNQIAVNFGDYETIDLVGRAETKRDELAKSDAIKAQIDAAKLLDKALAAGSKGGAAARRRGKGLLEKLVSKHPDTEAAERAQELLAQIGS